METESPSWTIRYRPQIRLAVRISVASLLAFSLSRLLGLTQGYPAVITTVIVMQGSLGASLRAMFDRFVGSLSGAIWGVAVLMALGHSSSIMMGITLLVVLCPLAVIVAVKPAYRPAPITALILIFSPGNESIPLVPAIHRMLGIGLGSIVALVVALIVLPSRAQSTLVEAARKSLVMMGELVAILLKAPAPINGRDGVQHLHDEIRKSLSIAEVAAEAASQERSAYLTGGPELQPLCRTLRRLYHDLAMIGRITAEALPEPLQRQLSELNAVASDAISAFLVAIGESLANGQPAPPIDDVEFALRRRESAIAEWRKAGFTRELSMDALGRIFGLNFGLEQMHLNLLDLADRTNDYAESRKRSDGVKQ